MDQEHPKPFQEEIVEIIAEVNTEKQEESLQEEEQSFEDYLIPQPAFEIDLNNQNLTEEEREAISYILSVRNQKQSLVSNKVLKNSQNQQRIQGYQLNTQINGQKASKDGAEDEIGAIESSISEWKIEHVSNWRCVVSNIQFINKHKKPMELYRQKLKEQIIFEQPEVNKITKNKWLNLPQIQELIIELSNYYCEILQESQNMQAQKHYYHIWIYSLLALHQSYASYTNFEALASVNACIQLQFRKHIENISTNSNLSKQPLQNAIIEWLTTLVILKQVFKQHFLGKYLVLLRKMQML